MARYPALALRIWRAQPWIPNPLMRISDRFEGLIRLIAVVVILAAVPVAGAVGTAVYTSSAAQIRSDNAAKVEVKATITGTPAQQYRVTPGVSGGGSYQDRFDADVRWNQNGRAGHTTTEVSGTAKVGDPVPMWLDLAGRPTDAPLPADAAGTRAITSGAAMLAGIWGGAVIVVVLTARLLDRSRSAAWAREWRLLSRPIGQDK